MSDYLKDLESRFKKKWKNGIGSKGVPYPRSRHKWALMFLFESMPSAKSQEEITTWYLKNNLQPYDRQVRHQAAKGWYLKTGNKRSTNMVVDQGLNPDQIRLVSMDQLNPIQNFANRTGSVSKLDWDEKVKVYEKERGGCAVCGMKYDHYDKGHLDRSKGMEIENLVPTCTDCNNWAQFYDYDFKLKENSFIARPVPRANRK